MNVPLRVLACSTVLSGAVLLVGVLVPWLGGPSLLPADLHKVLRTLLEQREREATLQARDDALLDSLAVKRLITADVIAGRTSLAEAVAEFRRLRQRQREELGPDFPGVGDEIDDAGMARQVMTWVLRELRDDPRRDAVLDRLEADLEDGKLFPPGPEPARHGGGRCRPSLICSSRIVVTSGCGAPSSPPAPARSDSRR